jgi:hypothetical protein
MINMPSVQNSIWPLSIAVDGSEFIPFLGSRRKDDISENCTVAG